MTCNIAWYECNVTTLLLIIVFLDSKTEGRSKDFAAGGHKGDKREQRCGKYTPILSRPF